MKLSEIWKQAGFSGKLESDGEFLVLEQCTRIRSSKALTFLENPKYASALEHPDISCVICTPEARGLVPEHVQGVVVSEEPKVLFFELHNLLAEPEEKKPTVIDPTAQISPLAHIAPYNVEIGKNVVIEPFVVVNENSRIEDDVRICSHCVIGAQSFMAIRRKNGTAFMARDAGKTVLEQGVEISNSTNIERGTLKNDVTLVGAYSKLDMYVAFGHGTLVGKRTNIAGGTVIGGNCVIGEEVWLGLNSTVSNRITIGDRGRVSLGAVVTKDVPAGATVTGNLAIDHVRFMKNLKESVKE